MTISISCLNEPVIMPADEPTAKFDSVASAALLHLMHNLNNTRFCALHP